MESNFAPVKLEPGQVLQVRKWKEVFERSDARKLKHLTWVSMPTGFESNGLQLLFDDFGERAISYYGAWCFLVKIAATSSERGRLGGSQGKSYSVNALSRLMCGVPAALIEELIAWCVHRSGWLEIVQAGTPHDSPDTPELPVSENLGKSPDYRTGPDRTQQDIPAGRLDARPEFDVSDAEEAGEVAKQVKSALRITRPLTDSGRQAVYRFACWSRGSPAVRQEVVALLREEQPAKPWRFLFAACRARDPTPDTFAARWDACELHWVD